jgi:tryptophan synthase alpha chain
VRIPPHEAPKPVNRIRTAFQRLQSQGKKALIPYITPDFPVRGTTVPLILDLEKAGATHIEVGIPFSDPIADGATIQRSSHIAIQNGATIGTVLTAVKEARRHTSIPIVLMGYVNPILRYGMERFLRDANECGVDGMIVPDLLPEESGEWRQLSLSYAMSNVFLMAPTTSEKRIGFLDSISKDRTSVV